MTTPVTPWLVPNTAGTGTPPSHSRPIGVGVYVHDHAWQAAGLERAEVLYVIQSCGCGEVRRVPVPRLPTYDDLPEHFDRYLRTDPDPTDPETHEGEPA